MLIEQKADRRVAIRLRLRPRGPRMPKVAAVDGYRGGCSDAGQRNLVRAEALGEITATLRLEAAGTHVASIRRRNGLGVGSGDRVT